MSGLINRRHSSVRSLLSYCVHARHVPAALNFHGVLAKEHVYVCPGGGIPGLLPSGILPEAVKSAGNLDSALKQFHSTLSKLGGSTFSLMTFGPSSLRCYLHPQAYKICLSLQKYLYRYLDIVKEFTNASSAPNPPATVVEMAESLGIHTEGTVNPGLDELALVGQVAQKLISQGHHFQAQEQIKDDVKLDVTPDHALVKEGCVVRLRGLPFQATLKDVSGFLSGLNYIPGGIVFDINASGRRTGEALAVLENAEQALLALKRHHQYLNQRYIEVYESSPDDFSRLTGGSGGGGGEGGSGDSNVCVVRMQGLPYRVEETEIVTFFQENAEVWSGTNGVFIVHHHDGRSTGDGFALFADDQQLTRALSLNKSMINSRYVELFRSSLTEFKMVLTRSGSASEKQNFSELLGFEISESSNSELGGSDKNCVKLRGAPYAATPEKIIEFFGDISQTIATRGVHQVLNSGNRPTGEYYVQMNSEEAAREASTALHKKYIGTRYIEVFQCSGDELVQGIQGHGGGFSSGGGRDYDGEFGGDRRGGRGGGMQRNFGGGGDGNVVKVRGLPYSATETDLSLFFKDYDVKDKDIEIIFNRSGRPSGLANVQFSDKGTAQKAISEMHGKHVGSRYVELSLS